MCACIFIFYVDFMATEAEFLIGLGSDDHRISKTPIYGAANSKPLILAGEVVSTHFTPIAHSDGDVVYHAIMNAIFLALGERDIGVHFPDTDKKYLGLRSTKMLSQVVDMMKGRGYLVNNISIMITAGEPKINPHIVKMRRNVAEALGIDEKYVGIGATTGEKLTAHGRGEGINAISTVLLKHI